MTPAGLVSTLAIKLREVLKNFELPAEYQAGKHVSVYEHDLPYGDENDTLIPFVVVSLLYVEDDGTDSIAAVKFTIGTYAGKVGNDWRVMLNIAERIRQFILVTDILAEKYLREFPMVFQPVSIQDQPTPFIYGEIAVKFRVATLRPAFDDSWRGFYQAN